MSHPDYKSDRELGQRVRDHLESIGLETPMTTAVLEDDEFKIREIALCMEDALKTLGLDLEDDSLMDTPNRIAKMWVKEIFWGLDYDKFPKCTTIENKMGKNSPGSFVVERNVNVQSNCEHHFVVIDGKACVAYIPREKVLGLSKLNRIVEFFAKRPQVQERLTEQIAATISFVTGTPDVAVYLEAVHYCVKSRGIQDTGSSTCTLAVEGVFADPQSDLRREFLNIARGTPILN
jgi:GTP cyclohydrolase I